MTLNMMRTFRLNPNMSAYTALEGQFDFKKTLLAPPRINVIVHEKPQHRKSWGIHGLLGWCIGPAMEHYQCYTCYTPNTREKRNADVVEFLPQHLIMPGLSAAEKATKASKELIHVIKNTGPQKPFTIG